jgi:hypothetical protein
MDQFEKSLDLLMEKGESAVLSQRRTAWSDTVTVAAEIEALTAYRALVHWGTTWGMYVPSRYYRRYGPAA